MNRISSCTFEISSFSPQEKTETAATYLSGGPEHTLPGKQSCCSRVPTICTVCRRSRKTPHAELSRKNRKTDRRSEIFSLLPWCVNGLLPWFMNGCERVSSERRFASWGRRRRYPKSFQAQMRELCEFIVAGPMLGCRANEVLKCCVGIPHCSPTLDAANLTVTESTPPKAKLRMGSYEATTSRK